MLCPSANTVTVLGPNWTSGGWFRGYFASKYWYLANKAPISLGFIGSLSVDRTRTERTSWMPVDGRLRNASLSLNTIKQMCHVIQYLYLKTNLANFINMHSPICPNDTKKDLAPLVHPRGRKYVTSDDKLTPPCTLYLLYRLWCSLLL